MHNTCKMAVSLMSIPILSVARAGCSMLLLTGLLLECKLKTALRSKNISGRILFETILIIMRMTGMFVEIEDLHYYYECVSAYINSFLFLFSGLF